MKKGQLHLKKLTALLGLAALCFSGTLAKAQSVPSREDKPVQDNTTARDNDGRRAELSQFDQFLDSHPEIAEQLRKDPSLADNKDFVAKHPALQTYLQEHPEIRAQLRENPNNFMRQENNFDRREDARDRDTRPAGLSQFDQFLDSHQEIAEQLRKDPSLADNKDFAAKHPALQTYLQEHPEIRAQLRDNPNAFMRQENNFDRREDVRDRDTRPAEFSRFDQFLDSHREIAEQLRKDPSLADNRDFIAKHPALQTYLQEHPDVREQLNKNPDNFMRQENNFDRREDTRFGDKTRGQIDNFNGFLASHSTIAQQLKDDPSKVRNHEYLENHPELQAYLKAHPDVHDELMKNPQSFVKAAQPVGTTPGEPYKAPTFDTKPKQ